MEIKRSLTYVDLQCDELLNVQVILILDHVNWYIVQKLSPEMQNSWKKIHLIKVLPDLCILVVHIIQFQTSLEACPIVCTKVAVYASFVLLSNNYPSLGKLLDLQFDRFGVFM